MSADWHYRLDGAQQGPVTREQLVALLRSGQLPASELVWQTGMANWVPATQVAGLCPPEVMGAAPAVGVIPYSSRQIESLTFTPRAMEMLVRTRPWVRFIGILLFIGAGLMVLAGGALMVLSLTGNMREPVWLGLIYLVFAGLYIMPGIYLSRYASGITSLQRLNRADVLEGAMEAQKSFWRFCGIAILAVIGLYIAVLVIVVLFAALR